ncbi:MAG TPA: hydantoinase/oxoprolinase family protein [Streptosporangiaceae bacterium]|nr:hydantoinase/oxoprolinase family protein [Streptosporangiaceae bacterium]
MSRNIRIGIDVGGTNTDAVAVRGTDIIGAVKRPTTAVVTEGIVDALNALLATSRFMPAEVSAVMVGTTQFVNAVVQAKGLARTGVVRIGLPATTALPPLVDWPPMLRRAIGDHVFLCRGGHEYDGSEIAPLDRGRLREVADDLAARGVASVAITSVFSPINADLELETASIIAAKIPAVPVTLSSDLGRIGLLERENATAMNACLRVMAAGAIQGFEDALAAVGITGQLFVSQNDGTLMNADYARRFPVATFASGPTNSMRGAAFLSGLGEAAVVDVGGTTADIGVLSRGFPRQAALAAEVGGVRTNFRMPDVLSLGIGGGSIVHQSGQAVTVGPDSVGYQLRTRGLVFGGDTLTSTDLAVAAGRAHIGDPARVAQLDRSVIEAGLAYIESAVTGAIDRMKISPEPVPVIVVGGGGALVRTGLPGVSEVVRPDNGEVANAIGAAMAQVGGEVDRIVHAGAGGRKRAVDEVVQEAVDRAVDAGAVPDSVIVVQIDEVPVSYLPGDALRVRAKAVGDLPVAVTS